MHHFVTAHKIDSLYGAQKEVILQHREQDRKSCPERVRKITKKSRNIFLEAELLGLSYCVIII